MSFQTKLEWERLIRARSVTKHEVGVEEHHVRIAHGRRTFHKHYSYAWLCSIPYLASSMGLTILPPWEETLEHWKKFTLVRIMNSSSMKSKNTTNIVNVFQ
jgi:hypothetical protein